MFGSVCMVFDAVVLTECGVHVTSMDMCDGYFTRDCCYELPRRIDLDDISCCQIYLVDLLVRIVKLSEPVVIQHHLMFDCYIVSQCTCVRFDLPGFRKMSANAWYTHYCLKCMWMET
jgi:hypothetical protein